MQGIEQDKTYHRRRHHHRRRHRRVLLLPLFQLQIKNDSLLANWMQIHHI